MTALPAASEPLRVDIWSDIACPWCYVGKRRFETALEGFAGRDAVEVVWHAFELDPSAPVEETRKMRDILGSKYGQGAAGAQAMLDNMTQTAAAEGLEYPFERLVPTNTFDAHRVIHLAAHEGKQDAMKERLLAAYFTEGKHVGSRDTLATLAAEVGLDGAAVRAALDTDAGAAEVRQDQTQARAYGISGVPFFVLGGKYGVSGAQPAEVLRGALEQLWGELNPAPLTMLSPVAGAGAAEGCEDGSCAVPEKTVPERTAAEQV
ncbi:DsbA family oxidoreductase [Deinococcus sp. Arct2-2]|uniref:DsbA family oxidoreductase n=1 Tax=Deinococcus sp. Arct2-2 TaxID=2568653 RepID=UPI0010A31BC7|nr:DsbA family oxidoreductase [Deinococcus sp. Arct2-2]THF68300.1 DsbA family oxidoreductase [Deinococcus sp. Arct2-2]